MAGRLEVSAVGEAPPDGDFLRLPEDRHGAWLRRDGALLCLAGDADWGARVRHAVPYASWLQGLPLLHAAAVDVEGGAHALLGASGVGKSSLSRRLDSLGHRRLYDDLAPCRRAGSRFAVALAAGVSIPLAALVFLERAECSRPRLEDVSRARAVRRLARDGWGDLRLRELWRSQFEFHTALATSLPTMRLVMPEDAGRLDASAKAAAALLAEV